MGAPRVRKNLIKSRRRVDDDGEEEGSVAAGEEDSLSEGSVISDADDADAEGSDGSDPGSPVTKNSEANPVANGHPGETQEPSQPSTSDPAKPPLSTMTGDTEAMMNGLNISGKEVGEDVQFDDLANQPVEQIAQNHLPQENTQPTDTLGERRRREHEEYKKKRDADPAFVPNRGGFFMHDHRSAAPGQNGFRPFGRGRGRGRGGIGGPYPSSRYALMRCTYIHRNATCLHSNSHAQALGPAYAPWAHDLHETVAQPNPQAVTAHDAGSGMQYRQKPFTASAGTPPPNRSFSRTTRIGNVQIRVLLGGMADPIVFSAVAVNQHTRLPHHRPPLRRDKPVRISLPHMPIRYIFPATERSFIFIPRALRPNQQGFGRVRGRGSLGGGFNGFGPLSSRRTSAYAGSAYSPSVAMSRRSSLAREPASEGIVQAAGAPFPRPSGMSIEVGKPVVRLPPAAEQLQATGQISTDAMSAGPTVNLPQASAYPLPQRPAFLENLPAGLPMHHPKPERTLQVADIESPATLEFNPPQPQRQQPFHQQVPMQVNSQVQSSDPSQYPHSRHSSHQEQASGGTPLPQISERSIHAQPFQPYPYHQPQSFYPQQFPPPMYFYPHADQNAAAPSAAAPPFVPGQQYFYPMPMAAAPQPPPTEPTTQAGTVAHERGGMVYYYNPAELSTGAEGNAQYQQTGYAAPQAGAGGMMTPPMHYFPQPTVYYPPQPQ